MVSLSVSTVSVGHIMWITSPGLYAIKVERCSVKYITMAYSSYDVSQPVSRSFQTF